MGWDRRPRQHIKEGGDGVPNWGSGSVQRETRTDVRNIVGGTIDSVWQVIKSDGKDDTQAIDTQWVEQQQHSVIGFPVIDLPHDVFWDFAAPAEHELPGFAP